MSFYEELIRRNVVKVAVLYFIGSWLILQIADVLFANLGVPEWAFGLVLGLLILFFFPVMVISWVYEMTPDGLKLEKDVDRSQSMTPKTGRKINVLIIVLLVLAIGSVIVDRLVPEIGPVSGQSASDDSDGIGDPDAAFSAPSLSIAVLPFADMSPDKDQEYFTDGISEELLNLLARVPDFRVAGRTSSFAFKGKNEDLRVIGQKLGVSAVLEGSVRKDGEQIRVTAQLVKTADGYHVWSDAYDRKLENIFALQDDIAQQVVSALKETLLGEGNSQIGVGQVTRDRPTDNSEAYASYLRGRHFQYMLTFDGISRAIDEYQRAIDLDPAFADAYAGLAQTYWMMMDAGFRSEEELRPLELAAIDEALKLNPDLSEGLTAKALSMMTSRDRNIEEVMSNLERAVELNPNNSHALVLLSNIYSYSTRKEDAEGMMRRAYEVDPLSPLVLGTIALTLKEQGDDAQSARYIDELAAVDPGSAYLYRTRSKIAIYDRDFVEATKWRHRAVMANPRDIKSRLDLASSLVSIGALDAADRYIREAYELNPSGPRLLARLVDIMQYQGDKEAALAMLEHELETSPTDLFLQSYRSTVLFHMERFDEARAQIESLAPALLEEPPRFTHRASFFYGPRLVWSMRRDGDDAQAKAIYDAFYETIDGDRTFGLLGGRNFLTVRWEAGMGNRDAMLTALAAVAETSNGSWELFQDPMFYYYADDPEYAALASRFEAIRAQHRQALTTAGVL